MNKSNIFDFKNPSGDISETFDNLFSNENMMVERIVSHKSLTTSDFWFDLDKNEWVILMSGEAKIEFENNEIIELFPGDYILIPSHKKHRVIYTSESPKCVWLGIHFK
jgi:cupin 2 domain-containing protein